MKKSVYQLVSATALALVLNACGTVPITGRSSLNLVSDEDLIKQSQYEYNSFVAQAKLQGSVVVDERIQRITANLIRATQLYLANNGYSETSKQMMWELNVVRSKDINAFCMPGGKIVVYTGLAQMIGTGLGTDDELAAVIGHEIAHAIARHANERVSQAELKNMGGQILGSILGNSAGSTAGGLLLTTLYGLGTEAAITLPFNRKQELEADKIGLVLMALAGYHPQYAVSLWQKMERNSSGASNSFWSTHPSEAKRIEEIQGYMPEAMKYYKKSQQAYQEQTAQPTTNRSKRTTKKNK